MKSLSGVDAAFLHLETPETPMHVASVSLFDLFGRTPKLVSDIPSSMLSSKASVVMTNVAGSPHTLYVAGVPIERVMFWVPHPGENLGMGISILSYRGYATLAIVTDAHLVPDPETITQRFQQEFVTMLSAARRAEGRRSAAGGRAAKAAVPRKAVAKKAAVARKSATQRA